MTLLRSSLAPAATMLCLNLLFACHSYALVRPYHTTYLHRSAQPLHRPRQHTPSLPLHYHPPPMRLRAIQQHSVFMCEATAAEQPPSAAPSAAGLLVTMSAAVGSLLQGYDTGVIAGALLFIVPYFHLESNPAAVGAIVTATTIGGIVGTAVSGMLSEQVGRRGTLLLASALFILGGIQLAWSPTVLALIIGRFVVGLGMGMASAAVPLYIAESADQRTRGALATIPQLLISTGILLSYVVDLVIVLLKGSWRWMLGLSLVPAVMQLMCMLWLPESPRWLLKKAMRGRKPEANENRALLSLAQLRRLPATDASVLAEFAAMRAGLEAEDERRKQALTVGKVEEEGSFTDLISTDRGRTSTLVCVCLQMFQQLCGINAIVYYTPQILRDVGVPVLFARFGLANDASSMLATMLAYIPKIPALLWAMHLMDSMGRRALLLRFIPLMGACLACLAASFTALAPGSTLRAGVALVAVMAYGIMFVMSLGPVPSILSSEIFPSSQRSMGMAVSTSSQWLFNAGVSMSFPVLVYHLGISKVLMFFVCMCILAQIFTLNFVPETKGRTLEELSNADITMMLDK